MDLEDRLNGMEESENFHDMQKEHYRDIKRTIKDLKRNKNRVASHIISQEIYNKTSSIYFAIANNVKKTIACSLIFLGVAGYMSGHGRDSLGNLYSALTPGKSTEDTIKSAEDRSVKSTPERTNRSPSGNQRNYSTVPETTQEPTSPRQRDFVNEVLEKVREKTQDKKAKSKTQRDETRSQRTPQTPQKQDYDYLMPPSDYVYFPVRGDTLSKIARDVTGNSGNWRKILDYNNLTSSDIRNIEVNQPIVIPSELARYKGNLFDGVIVKEADVFDGTHLPVRHIRAGRNSNLSDISLKLYGTTEHSNKLLSYNREINPRFSPRIYHKQYVFVPPKSYIKK